MALRATDLVEQNCLNCNKQFKTQYRNLLRNRGKFCSKKCSNTYPINRINKRNKQLDSGNGKTYRKYFKKHEHRVVMENILGRQLLKGEVVHHKDGNKRNNNPENLELFSNNSEHLRQHLIKNVGKCFIYKCENKQARKNLCFKHYYRSIRNAQR